MDGWLLRKGEGKGKGTNIQQGERKRKGQDERGEGRQDRPFEGFERLRQEQRKGWRGDEGKDEKRTSLLSAV